MRDRMEIMMNEITERNRKYILFSNTNQRHADPDIYERGKGIHIYDYK